MKTGKAHVNLSLTPGFSPVLADGNGENRFTGFPRPSKPLNLTTARPHPAKAGS
jgi:hypothetical protein